MRIMSLLIALTGDADATIAGLTITQITLQQLTFKL